MKHLTTIFLIALFVMTFSACDLTEESRQFYAIDSTDNSIYTLSATKEFTGTYCEIYLETGNFLSTATIEEIGAEFDSKIWDSVGETFGAPGTDIDENGKIILLLLDIKDGYSGYGSYIAGYFDSAQQYTNEQLVASGYSEQSNEAEMLFIDTYPSESEDMLGTIVHELQHLIHFTTVGNTSPTWINEGFSAAGEAIYAGTTFSPGRLDFFNEDTLTSNGIQEERRIRNGYPLVAWNPYNDTTAVLNNYALVSLFFGWANIHSPNDTLYKDYFSSLTAKMSQIEADKSNIGEVAAIALVDAMELSGASTFESVVTNFYQANYNASTNNESGIAGYNGKADIKVTVHSSGTPTLYPGGAMYFTGTQSGSDGSIDYASLSDSGTVAVNTNSNLDGGIETGSTFSYVAPSSSIMAMRKMTTDTNVELPKSAYRIGLEGLKRIELE